MPSIQVNSTPFGQISNQIPKQFYLLDQYIERLAGAVAAAASGYNGTAGAEYENQLFGVVAGAAAGDQGAAWAYAVNNLKTAWDTFKTSAQASITALDNG